MTEQRRACGWRKIGGMYLVGGSAAAPCDFLPYELTTCRHCGAGVKPCRGFTWLTRSFFGPVTCLETCRAFKEYRLAAGRVSAPCPMDAPPDELFGLLWIGERFYPTPADFMREAGAQGISRRISQVPKNLILGETWVMLAHRRAVLIEPAPADPELEPPAALGGGSYRIAPAIFSMFRPTAIEKILTHDLATPEEIASLERRGITPVIVDDRERHHTGDDDQDPLPFPEAPAAEGGAE